MSKKNNLEQSQLLDNLNLNQRDNYRGNEDGKNPYFMRNNGYNGGYNAGYNNRKQFGNNNNRNNNYYQPRNNYQGERLHFGGGGNEENKRNYNGGGYYEKNYGHKGSYYKNDYYGGYDRRNGGNNNNYKRNWVGYEKNDNFNRPENNKEENEANQMIKEAMYEKEKDLKEFKKTNKDIIESFKILFVNEGLKEEEIIEIIKNINTYPSLTIFEAMNLIEREVKIIKTLQFVHSGQKREYGPNKDILEPEFEPYFPKKNLREVIQKYKTYKKNSENTNEKIVPEEWLYIDDSDQRRQLIKDELGYFNYLPILNPNNSDEKENIIYARNDNELTYHYLFYKTLMCKYCDLSDEQEQENNLCPYAHNILNDFRIIYDYKNEEISKFMLLLLDSKLFHFENYLNYIPMSISPEFNLDTFKVHKCQLDKSCPTDYHLCPYYHKSVEGDEQRRPPLLFGYCGNPGDICFNEKKKKYCPKKCKCGIFCHYLHNKNEYNYHLDHFRKEYKCKRKKIKGKCIYYKTCYGIHPNGSDNENSDNEEEEEEEEEDEKKMQEEIDNDEKIIENKKEVDNSLVHAKIFRCRKCQNVDDNGKLIFFMKCNHFLCVKCFKKIYAELKSGKKKNKKEAILTCPFCNNTLGKEEIIKTFFNKK